MPLFAEAVRLSLQYSQWTAATVITVSPISDMQRQTGSDTRL